MEVRFLSWFFVSGAVRAALGAVVVDCSGLAFCDCSGFDELLRARRAAEAAGVAFRLAAPSPQVARLLELTGTDIVLSTVEQVPAPEHPKGRPARRRPVGRGHDGTTTRAGSLAAEAARQICHGLWKVSDSETELARTTAEHLGRAVGPVDDQRGLPVIERLERLREALAQVAMALARTHGPLAWFLAQTAEGLAPVLHRRTLLGDPAQAFGTVVPTPGGLADAEDAVRCLRSALVELSTAPHQAATAVRPDSGVRALFSPARRAGRFARISCGACRPG
ncbi:STAS domain-containing protein [Streptomyces sp. NPDC048331]|uniref:STAS domain-containing protein n=1 Tax=Streptomyces sp. NPDC048331 TaxID=3365534 RepID=UPI003717A213